MALNVWTHPSGYSLGSFPELVHIDQQLPVENDAGVEYSVISGSLPDGLFIIGNKLLGSPHATANNSQYTFCIRAKLNNSFADRTFLLTLTNIADPEFITPAGELNAGEHRQFYVLDGSFMSYQIQAVDLNPEPNEILTFSIEDGNGLLPPGLTLSSSGVISGFVGPTFVTYGNGNSNQYAVPFDFTVTITDGSKFNSRTFSIFVADPDAFRADSLMLDGLAGRFTADSTYLQEPVWVTNSNLGVYRANNYLTLPVGLYDQTSTMFRVEATNMEVYANTLQVTRNDNNVGKSSLTVTNVNGTILSGYYFTFANYFDGALDTIYRINSVTDLGNGVYRLALNTPLTNIIDNGVPFYIGTLSELPPGLNFDGATSELYGRIPYQPAITETYIFTITAIKTYSLTNEVTTTSKKFTISLLGDITSEISWVTPSNLGVLHANYVSTLNVVATTNISNANLTYKVTSGSLPPGVALTSDGELVGMVNQYYNSLSNTLGLITFDGSSTTFDNNTTTYDRNYTFTVTVNDQYMYSSSNRTFSLTIDSPNTTEYSDVSAHPFLAQAEREMWRNFITDATVFTPSSVYRPNDPNFGVQSKLEMLIFAGLETTIADTYVTAMENGFKRKRFNFSSIETALAIDPDTGNSVYEIVYAKMYDPMEPNGTHLPLEVLNGYYPNSISNWRARISAGLMTERNYLPLWMRTIQPGTKEQLGFTLAVPLCYCKVGTAADIALNIKYNGFDFKQLDYTLDRFIISAVVDRDTGAIDVSDKYLAFRNNRTTI